MRCWLLEPDSPPAVVLADIAGLAPDALTMVEYIRLSAEEQPEAMPPNKQAQVKWLVKVPSCKRVCKKYLTISPRK